MWEPPPMFSLSSSPSFTHYSNIIIKPLITSVKYLYFNAFLYSYEFYNVKEGTNLKQALDILKAQYVAVCVCFIARHELKLTSM